MILLEWFFWIVAFGAVAKAWDGVVEAFVAKRDHLGRPPGSTETSAPIWQRLTREARTASPPAAHAPRRLARQGDQPPGTPRP